MAGFRVGEAILGAIALGLAAFIAWGTWTAPAIAARSVVGPGVFPALIALGLAGVGLRLLFDSRARTTAAPEIPEIDGGAVLIVAGTLLAFIWLLPRLGWLVTAPLLFLGVARGFGSRRWGAGLLIGLALAAITLFVFDRLLGLSLPTGSWVEAALAGAGLTD